MPVLAAPANVPSVSSMRHLEVDDTSDKIVSLAALAGAVVLSAAVLGRELIMDPRANPPTDPPPSD